MKQKSSRAYICIGVVVVFFAIGGIISCGDDKTSECDCAICINDEPAYPCDSEDSCAEFAADQDCKSWKLVSDPTETCGDEAQPVCEVSGCVGQCQCPGEADADISEEYEL